MPVRESYGMGKKPGKTGKRDDGEGVDPDQFEARDFDWLDDRSKVAAAVPDALDLPRGKATRTLRELEMEAIREGLERNGGNKPRTAEELGISLKTLYNKIHQMDAEERKTA